MNPEIQINLILAVGGISVMVYLYLFFVSKSSLVKPLSKLVIFGLLFVGLISGLTKYSQIAEEEFVRENIVEIMAWSLLGPILCIGLAVFSVGSMYIFGVLLGYFEHLLKKRL